MDTVQKISAKHRLLIVEDHPIVSEGLVALINREADLEVCGVAEDNAAAESDIEVLKPDLVLLDMTLKGVGGLDLLKHLKALHPELKVVMLTLHDESIYAHRALRCGASGYVMKHQPIEVLFLTIRKVLAGGVVVAPQIEKTLLRSFLKLKGEKPAEPLEALSNRELEVFRLIGKGKGTREIASQLFLSPKTIETHRAHVMEKLNIRTALDLVHHAVQMQDE